MIHALSRIAGAATIVAGCLLTAGCKTDNAPPDDDDYRLGESIFVPEFDTLWERAKVTVMTEGWAVDEEETRFSERLIASNWAVRLAPARFEGNRTRAWVAFEEEDPTHWRVRVAVQRQRNKDIEDPLNLMTAQWEDQPMDEDRAMVLLWKIEAAFRTPGMQEEQAGRPR